MLNNLCLESNVSEIVKSKNSKSKGTNKITRIKNKPKHVSQIILVMGLNHNIK